MDTQTQSADCGTQSARPDLPDDQRLLHLLQSTLADIDFAYQSELKAMMNKTPDNALKQKLIEKLQRKRTKSSVPRMSMHRVGFGFRCEQ